MSIVKSITVGLASRTSLSSNPVGDFRTLLASAFNVTIFQICFRFTTSKRDVVTHSMPQLLHLFDDMNDISPHLKTTSEGRLKLGAKR
jgi:hypothetical protein